MLFNIGQCKCPPANEHKPRPACACLEISYISLANIVFQMLTCNARCVHAFVDDFCRWRTLLSRSEQALADSACRWPMSMSSSWCAHSMSYVCIPLMMLYSIVQRHWPDTPKPSHMCEDLGWCCLPLANVAWRMHAVHDQWFSLDWCAHATADVCITWMMLPAFGYSHLASCARHDLCRRVDAHMPRLMRARLVCCFLLLADVRRHQPMLPSR